MPKAYVVASVITAEILPPTIHAVDLNSLRHISRCSDLDPIGYGFHLTRGMLIVATHTNVQAGSFPVPYRWDFCKCKCNFDTYTCKCFMAHLACDKNCGNCKSRICDNKESQID